MKSAQITRYGNTSEVIKINQTNAPNLSAGKVLVNVQVAGINPIDWKIREGPLACLNIILACNIYDQR
jgi:NADPH:quinone reductase-like Zn-dependent oxidoreductase